MWKYGVTLVLAAALLVSGCREQANITYTPPALKDDWSVKLTLSGGIAGLLRHIEVNAEGLYSVTDERMQKTATGKLTEQELIEVEGLITNLQFTPPEIPSACADCFVYDIEIASGGQKMIVNADDVNLEDSGVGTLVQFLREIMDSALK